METVIYYGETDGIALERLVRKGAFHMHIHHFHNQYEIFYLVQGERQFFFDNHPYHISSGSLILVDENVLHMTGSSKETDLGHDRIILYIDKDKMKQLDHLFPHLGLTNFFHQHYGVYQLTQHQQKEFLSLYELLTQELTQKEHGYKAMIDLSITQYFLRLIREKPALAPDQLSAHLDSNHYICEIANYITTHCSEIITLDLLSERFFISKYYLCRIFKKATGYRIGEYINLCRIRNAKRLLEESDLNIAAVAAQSGFDSATYFERVFKKYMSISPLRYRKTKNTVTYQNQSLNSE